MLWIFIILDFHDFQASSIKAHMKWVGQDSKTSVKAFQAFLLSSNCPQSFFKRDCCMHVLYLL
jgi:hypothetical protein